ncbi:hypothetical protein D3C72_577700 [compost metagenome]
MANAVVIKASSFDCASENTTDRPQQTAGEQGADHAAADRQVPSMGGASLA